MPRRIIESPCKCGCGRITRNGGYVRGHHTVTRWHLVNAMTTDTETRTVTEIREDELFGYYDSITAGQELARRGWLLPNNHRHFGVEMEVISRSCAAVADALRAAGLTVTTGSYSTRAHGRTWVVKTDGSLRANDANRSRGNISGVEVVSPPLRGRDGFAELKKACAALNAAGVDVNKTCGLHVHHEAKDFTLDTFKSLVKTYAAAQNKIDAVLAASRRTGKNSYCKTFTASDVSYIDSASTVREIGGRVDRYRVLNLTSFASYGTVEFRQHQGSTDYEKIRNWILAGQAMMRAAKKGTVSDGATFGDMVEDFGTKTGVGAFFKRRARTLSGTRRQPERNEFRNDLNPAGVRVSNVTVVIENFTESFRAAMVDTMNAVSETAQQMTRASESHSTN